MIRNFLLIAFITFAGISAFAQDGPDDSEPPIISADPYKFGIGIRAGFDAGLNLKIFTKEETVKKKGGVIPAQFIEVLASHNFIERYSGFKIVVLAGWQKRNGIHGMTIHRLSWIYGIGGHIGHYAKGAYPRGGRSGYYPTAVTPIGIDAMLGMEHRFGRSPLTMTLDVRPFFEFYKRGPELLDLGLTLRYVI